MMKKNFQTPVAEFVYLHSQDVLTLSNGIAAAKDSFTVDIGSMISGS